MSLPVKTKLHHYEVQNGKPVQPKACDSMVSALNKPNLPAPPALNKTVPCMSFLDANTRK
jgi:hypothetical protein